MMIPQPTVLDEILGQLRQSKVLSPYKTLGMIDRPTIEQLNGGKVDTNIGMNQFFAIISGSTDIEIGTSFSVIIPRRNIGGHIRSSSILKYVSINPSYEVSYLPGGYSGLGLFEFPDGNPSILQKLPYYNEKWTSNHDMLILTQEPVLDAILHHELYIRSCSSDKI